MSNRSVNTEPSYALDRAAANDAGCSEADTCRSMLCASYREQMDKLVFLMQRKVGATRESFYEHYLAFHSLLGLRLVPSLDGYIR